MPTSSRARAATAKQVTTDRLTTKRVLVFVGLCLFVIVASIAGSVFVMRQFFSNQPSSASDAPSLQRVTTNQQALTNRLASAEQEITNLKSQRLSSDQLYALNQASDYTSYSAMEQLIQEHLFARDVKTVGDEVRIVPFNTQLTLGYVPMPTSIWNRYPERRLSWGKDSSYWMLHMSRKQQDFSLALNIRNGMSDPGQPFGCEATKYTDREHQVAQLMLSIAPDADICGHIEVGPALKGGHLAEEDPITHKIQPVVVRPYIYYYQPRTQSSNDTYSIEQPVALVVVVREHGDVYWKPVIFEWNISSPLNVRSNDFLTARQFKTAQQDIKTWVNYFEEHAPLYSGFCGYDDCY